MITFLKVEFLKTNNHKAQCFLLLDILKLNGSEISLDKFQILAFYRWTTKTCKLISISATEALKFKVQLTILLGPFMQLHPSLINEERSSGCKNT